MKTGFAIALAATMLIAACERAPQPKTTTAPDAGSGASSVPAQPRPQTSTPSMEQKKEGSNPQQGQVDPKQSAQHRDFEQSGDKSGPKSAETQPK